MTGPSVDAGVAARHSSESNEHFTPLEFVAAARDVMGGIELDPASCALANRTVRADRYYDAAINGFLQPWHGRVFLNPPGGWQDTSGRRVIKKTKTTPPCTVSGACGLPPGHEHDAARSSAKEWWFKLMREVGAGRVTQAIFVGFSVEILQTTQVDRPDGLAPVAAWPLCFPSRRVPYLTPRGDALVVGDSPPHSTVFVYVGSNVAAFGAAFSQFGWIVNGRGPT